MKTKMYQEMNEKGGNECICQEKEEDGVKVTNTTMLCLLSKPNSIDLPEKGMFKNVLFIKNIYIPFLLVLC